MTSLPLSQNAFTAAPSSVPPTLGSASTAPISATAPGPPVTFATAPVSAAGTTAGGMTLTSVQASAAPASGEEPIKALDQLAEPTMLDRAMGMAKPYLEKVDATTKPYIEKVQATTKPYVDAAGAKAAELIDRIEGTGPATGTATTSTPSLASTAPTATTTTSTSTLAEKPVPAVSGLMEQSPAGAARRASLTQEVGDRAKGMFAAVTSSFNQLTTSIDEKTKSPTHPGFITQVTTAFEKGVEKVDGMLNPSTVPAGHPVQTTTNSVPHTSAAPDLAGPSSIPANTPAPIAPVALAGSSIVPPP